MGGEVYYHSLSVWTLTTGQLAESSSLVACCLTRNTPKQRLGEVIEGLHSLRLFHWLVLGDRIYLHVFCHEGCSFCMATDDHVPTVAGWPWIRSRAEIDIL